MSDFWIRETRVMANRDGVTVVIGSDDRTVDGQEIAFDDLPKVNDWGALDQRVEAYVRERIVDAAPRYRRGGSSGAARVVAR